MRSLIKSLINRMGFDIIRSSHKENKRKLKDFYYESDEAFMSFHKEAIKVSDSPHDPAIFPLRLYNTLQFLIYSLSLEGDIVECGCFKGRSSYLFCTYAKYILGEFCGEGYHIFDSFQGISEPGINDQINSPDFGKTGHHFLDSGAFSASLEHVKKTLESFPNIHYHPGWIPDTFDDIPDLSYKFVHLDLDLYDPIRASIDYFYPRLVPGGVIVIDEYGFPRWPGAKRAVDEFCDKQNIKCVGLTTGNGVIIKV
jgi:O-methyltransferase